MKRLKAAIKGYKKDAKLLICEDVICFMPKNEIEAKVLEVDEEKLSEKLEEIGAKKVFDSEIRSELYDFPDGRIEEDGILRLRTRQDKSFVTRKQKVAFDDAKEMREIEFDIDRPDEFRAFMSSIGAQKIHENTKNRVKWVKDDIEFVIDKFQNIPPFIEIEAPDRTRMKQAFKELGFSENETVNWGTKEIFEHYSEESEQ